jgi:hypothetical protein
MMAADCESANQNIADYPRPLCLLHSRASRLAKQRARVFYGAGNV